MMQFISNPSIYYKSIISLLQLNKDLCLNYVNTLFNRIILYQIVALNPLYNIDWNHLSDFKKLIFTYEDSRRRFQVYGTLAVLRKKTDNRFAVRFSPQIEKLVKSFSIYTRY